MAARLVGRTSELAVLIDGVEEALRGGHRRFALVGPAGIGKTRLVHEIGRYATWRGLQINRSESRTVQTRELVLIDPLDPTWVQNETGVDRGRVGPGRCLVATTRSLDTLRTLVTTEIEALSIGPLDQTDSISLLQELVPFGFDPTWARHVVQQTRGVPAALVAAAQRRRNARTYGPPDAPG